MDSQEWDQRYAGTELVWTAQPNRFVVEELQALPPGRALDLGAGEGRNAVWLADRGWEVTAVDFSAAGLDKGRRLAGARGLAIDWVHADLRDYQPGEGSFQLVLIAYLQYYNPGRYIRLEPLPSPHADIRDFRADLRACTDDAVSGEDSDHYSEQKFLQVSRIIERFRGREGLTEADRRWTRFVTDVRNWYTFAASERYREDDTEYEHYADSGGKSGGQKEKLAYTILAASLAYQFKLEWGAAKSRTFRFAVIDEAFGRGSDESNPIRSGAVRSARPAVANRHPAAEDPRHRAVRVRGGLRGQPPEQ